MEQEPIQDSYPMMQPGFATHASEGSLRYQLDSDLIIQEIEHNIKGEALTFNHQTGEEEWKLRPGAKPMINEIGVNMVISLLKSHLTKIFILSDLSEDKINDFSKDLGNRIVDSFEDNWRVYEIPSYADASIVVAMITNTVHATLCKAKMGNYLKFLRSTHSTHEVQNRSVQQFSQGPARQNENAGGVIKKLLGRR